MNSKKQGRLVHLSKNNTRMNVPKFVFVDKFKGETPLEALERYRSEYLELCDLPMTYAGRLDPMAYGKLLILIGDECKNKEKYLGLDKEYEIEVLFGIATDSYDALGLVSKVVDIGNGGTEIVDKIVREEMAKYPMNFEQSYPPFSSKTVGGSQLHIHAKSGTLPEEMPIKKVTIYEMELLGQSYISSQELKKKVIFEINAVKGDFRQKEIIDRWSEVLQIERTFPVFKFRVKCSSGTYMRSLAYRLGLRSGFGAFALSIRRTEIFGV